MASLLDLASPHLAYYSVPAAYLVAFTIGRYKSIASGKHNDPYMPRQIIVNVANDTSIDKQKIQCLQRADAAAANAYETLGLYAGGIAAAAAAGVPAKTLNLLGAAYVASRVVYTVVYVFLQDRQRFVGLRGAVWSVGVGIIMAVWIKAGNAAAARY